MVRFAEHALTIIAFLGASVAMLCARVGGGKSGQSREA